MKYKYSLFLLLLSSLSIHISCQKGDMDGKIPYISIEQGRANGDTISFVVKTENIDRAWYWIEEAGAGAGIGTIHEMKTADTQTIRESGFRPGYYTVFVKGTAKEETLYDTLDISISDQSYNGPEFRKRILINKFTATWCGYCPQMTTALDELAKEDPERFIIAALHSGDDLETRSTEMLSRLFSVSSYPTAVIDYWQSTSYDKDLLSAALDATEQYNMAVAGIGISSSIDEGNISIEIEVEAGCNGNYKVGCILTEDRIKRNNTVGSADGYYDHVVRTYASSPLGDEIAISAGETGHTTYTLEQKSYYNIDNCNIVAFVLFERDGKYSVTNAVHAKIGKKVGITKLN